MKRFVVFACLAAGMLAVPGWTLADTITLDNGALKLNGRDNYDYRSPDLPKGSPLVTFQELTAAETGTGHAGVLLTLDLTGMNDGNDRLYVRNWLFNFNPDKDLDALSIEWDGRNNDYAPSSTDVDVSKARDAFGLRGRAGDSSDDFSARGSSLYDVTNLDRYYEYSELGSHAGTVSEDALGLFDILFSFQFPDASGPLEFDVGSESVTFKVASSAYDVTAADFRFPSQGGSAMSAVGIWPSCENYEAWYSADAPPGVVPEPGTLVLLGTGLLGVGAWVRRRSPGSPGEGEDHPS